jgi:hypothetical protein
MTCIPVTHRVIMVLSSMAQQVCAHSIIVEQA